MSGQRNAVVSGAIAMTLAIFVVKVIGVLYKIPLSYLLGDEGMGYFNAAYTVYGFFYIISSAGVPKAVTMVIASGNSVSESNAQSFTKKLLISFGFIGVAVTLIFIVLSSPISALIGNSKAAATMLGIAPSIFFVAEAGVLRGYLNGESKLLPIAVSQVIEALSKLILGLIFAYLGLQLGLTLSMISALTVLGITLGSFFSLLYLYLTVFRKKNCVEKCTDHSYKGKFKQVIKIAIPITLSSSIIAISNVLDIGMIQNGLTASGYTAGEATALYGSYSTLALPMLTLITSLLTPVTAALLPKLVSAHNLNDTEAFNTSLNTAWKITVLIAIPAALIYYLYAFELLDLLFASSSTVNAFECLILLAPSAILLPLLNIVNTALESKGKLFESLISLLFGIAVKIIVSIILVGKSGIGIIGAAIGTSFSYLFSLCMSLIFMSSDKSVKLNVLEALPDLVISLILYVPPFVLIYAVNLCSNSVLSLLLALFLPTAIYLPIAYRSLKHKGIILSKHHNAQKK
ncbi:MAG: oligosaccharide flippase family protein [Clostridia bacterium]|nr:oligosaccharide flippase family protein [Clostridia bacterium]